MQSTTILVFVKVILIQLSISKVSCQSQVENTWYNNTYEGLSNLIAIPVHAKNTCDGAEQPFECYMELLTQYLTSFENFLTKTQLNREEELSQEQLERLFNLVSALTQPGFTTTKIENNFNLHSRGLKQFHEDTFKILMTTLQTDMHSAISTTPPAGYVLPLERACNAMPNDRFRVFSVIDVCPTLANCSTSIYESTTNACTEDNRCNVTLAIPMMIGVFFYKVSFAFVDKFCNERCADGNPCNNMEQEFARISKDLELMKTFLNIMNTDENAFEEFFRDAVTRRAYSEINAAMGIIGQNEERFNILQPYAHLACQEIKFEPACQVAMFYPNYVLLKKVKERRSNPGHPGDTRDLTSYGNMDHAKIIQLKRETIKHTQLLSAIDSLNDELKTHVQKIGSYFQGIASYDQAIANADVEFINGKLEEFNTRYTGLEDRLGRDLRNAMYASLASLTAQLVEASVALAFKIAQESNPLKAIFSGVDVAGVREQAVAVAKAAEQETHQIALLVRLGELADDTAEIGDLLMNNTNQITALKKIVNKIINNQANDIDKDADTFIDQYANYTPMVDRDRLAENIGMWEAFKESTCNLLNGVEAIGAAIATAVANGFALCENLEGTIAEFNALRENIFDFQFDLVDSLAAVVRGNVAKKLSASITEVNDDMYKADQLLGGFLMTQLFIQSQAWLYCDKLEYQNEGQRAQPCSPVTGLFTNNELDNIVAFESHETYVSIERTVHIPSKPQYYGDLGFINIPTLLRNKAASFRLPLNVTWLRMFDWSLIGESQASFVENFQLFLPKSEYETGPEKVKTSTRIVVTADTEAGSYISTNRESAVLYKLPKKQSSYVTVYQEGYRKSTCSKEISNPYGLCNNLPKICHTSSNVAGSRVLPTTLSRWTVTYHVQQGDEEIDWLAPNSTTDLYFIAKLTLRMLTRRSAQYRRSETERPLDQDVCCQGNTYRSSLVSSQCEACPDGSTSRLGGYFCETNLNTGDEPNPSTGQNRKPHSDENRNPPSGENHNRNPSTECKEHPVLLHGATRTGKQPQKGRALYTGRKIGWPKGHPIKGQVRQTNI